MKHKLIKLLLNKKILIDLFSDLRSASLNVIVVGGVSSFFGFTNHHYIEACGIIAWIVSSISARIFAED